jgi:hypothetical protein
MFGHLALAEGFDPGAAMDSYDLITLIQKLSPFRHHPEAGPAGARPG